MILADNLRGIIYSFLDYLKGSQVITHYKEIQDANNQQTSFDNSDALNKLLEHTRSTVPYYNSIESNDLSYFPVVNKTLIKENINNFISTLYKKETLYRLTTSGSTGTPFTVYQDKNKKLRNTADTLFFAKKAGYHVGEKLYYMKIWSRANHKSKKTKFIENIETIDVLTLDDKKVKRILSKFRKEKKTFGILSYVSALETVLNLSIISGVSKVDTKVNSVITMSESLSNESREKLTNFFGVPVVSRYSNVENGIIAQQNINGLSEFEINHASYFLEIFDMNKDEVLPDGKTGRIVLTDLYNYGMPLIRYDTGDIGCISRSSINNQRVLSSVEGRKLDLLYNTNGELVSSLLVYKNMWKYTEIDQYQLIQKSKKNYELKISSKSNKVRENELITEFKLYLGSDANVSINLVNEIPLLNSGKRRKVINEYYK